LSVFSTNGKKVITLIQGTRQNGAHAITWDGRDNSGNAIPSGTYIVSLKNDGSSWQNKVIYLK
jgi:flagellar hook assembly protein FlgD